MGLARALLVAGVVFALYRPAPDSDVEIPEDGPGAAGTAEKRMALFLLAGTLFWITDFFHGLHPVFGAILVEDTVSAGDLIRVTVACSLATILLLLPLQFGVFAVLY